MLGAIILIVVMILIPVAILMTGAVASAILGEAYRRNGVRTASSPELLDIPD
ncbi:MAG: hypothetical protein AB8G26_13575 [Ilumatobacter sp.]